MVAAFSLTKGYGWKSPGNIQAKSVGDCLPPSASELLTRWIAQRQKSPFSQFVTVIRDFLMCEPNVKKIK